MRQSNELQKNIDALGKIKEEIKKLTLKEKELSDMLKANLNVDVTAYGDEYSATLTTRVSQVIDVEKVAKKLSRKDFLSVVKVSMESLKNYMLEKDIEKCAKDITVTPVLTIAKRKEDV